MAENIQEYQELMEIGNDAAWKGQWEAAIDAYTQAVEFAPEGDAEALINLGLALLNNQNINKALKVYNQASKIAPQDPVPLEGAADALEKLGRLKEAAQQYVKVAEAYIGLKDLNRAIDNWERAAQLTPALVSVHARLAQAYERTGDKKRAIYEYLTLGFNFRRMNQTDKAIQAVKRALRLNRRHPDALNMLRALESGAEVSLPEFHGPAREQVQEDDLDDSGFFEFGLDDDFEEVGEADPRGPLGEATEDALGILAEFVVEQGLDMSVSFALQAMEQHRQSSFAEAIESYKQSLDAGMSHPALRLNLGALLLWSDQPSEGQKHFGDATMNETLAAGAFHGLGQCYYQTGDHKKASRFLIQSLQQVDMQSLANSSRLDDVGLVYETLLQTTSSVPDADLARLNQKFIGWLSGKDWKQRIPETRRQLEETVGEGGGKGMIEFIDTENTETLGQSVSNIDSWIRQGLYQLAMDEAHRTVENSPYYLPVHVRMAEIMMKERRIRPAIDKYNMVAKAYLVRGENDRAASILSEVLEMAPLDVEVRLNLMALLEDEERWDEALEQYIGLANTYQQLGDFDRSSETYTAAEKLAKRVDAADSKVATIKHRIADIAQLRLNTRQAQKVYEEILDIMPNDEKALRTLVDIYYSQGNQVDAIKRLDVLLGAYAKKGQIQRITQLLEELVRMYPQDTALRSRMASIYKRLERNEDAIEQLDALGELQLEAGLHQDAANTIRQIIDLKPAQVEQYQKLLSQLGG